MNRIFKVIGMFMIALFVVVFILPAMIMGPGMLLLPNPPKPEITYAEFPFKLTYELNGETKVVEDVVVCEFDGFESHGEAGKYRKWKQYIKSTGKGDITLLEVDDSLEMVYTIPGKPEDYMGDSRYGNEGVQYISEPITEFYGVGSIRKSDDGVLTYGGLDTAEAYRRFGIKLIRWESLTQPIVNNFK